MVTFSLHLRMHQKNGTQNPPTAPPPFLMSHYLPSLCQSKIRIRQKSCLESLLENAFATLHKVRLKIAIRLDQFGTGSQNRQTGQLNRDALDGKSKKLSGVKKTWTEQKVITEFVKISLIILRVVPSLYRETRRRRFCFIDLFLTTLQCFLNFNESFFLSSDYIFLV